MLSPWRLSLLEFSYTKQEASLQVYKSSCYLEAPSPMATEEESLTLMAKASTRHSLFKGVTLVSR